VIGEGTHNDITAGRRVIYTTKNGALALDIECIGENGDTITGTLYLAKTDGSKNGRALRTITDVFRVDYHDELALTEGEWPPFQIVVEPDEWNGKTRMKVKWFNVNHAEQPGRKPASDRFSQIFGGAVADPLPPPAEPSKPSHASTDAINAQMDLAAEGADGLPF
jgi:hypothetical protein